MTEVVAALVRRDGRIMLCQRPKDKARGLMWELVGGKVEAGETKEQALVRECMEELDVWLSVGKVFAEVVHTYSDLTIHLTVFCATIESGTPKKLEHNDIRWVMPEELAEYELCPADREVLSRLVSHPEI